MRSVQKMGFLALFALLSSSCSTDPVQTVRPELAKGGGNIQPMCVLGCVPPPDEDPYPESPGVWLGAELSKSNCYDPYFGADEDSDGIVDICEWNIAKAFAPLMETAPSDDVGGEPYWALQPIPGSSDKVIIVYMPAYYRDLGCWGGICTGGETGHVGDSEVVSAEVEWDEDAQHWVLKQAIMSAHLTYLQYIAYPNSYPLGLEYTDRPGGRFKVHVAWGKHSNYATIAECEQGGWGGTDFCGGPYPGTVFETLLDRNVGSFTAPFHDCVPSYGDYVGSGYNECFWDGAGVVFGGWQGATQAEGYKVRLSTFGFLECPIRLHQVCMPL